MMQVDFRSGVYIFSRSRGDHRAAELLLLRIRARREPFGLSSAISAICRVRPLWPSAPRMGNWLPCKSGRPQGPRPARGSECTRRAYFRAKRAKRVQTWVLKFGPRLTSDARLSVLSSEGRRPLSHLPDRVVLDEGLRTGRMRPALRGRGEDAGGGL